MTKPRSVDYNPEARRVHLEATARATASAAEATHLMTVEWLLGESTHTTKVHRTKAASALGITLDEFDRFMLHAVEKGIIRVQK